MSFDRSIHLGWEEFSVDEATRYCVEEGWLVYLGDGLKGGGGDLHVHPTLLLLPENLLVLSSNPIQER